MTGIVNSVGLYFVQAFQQLLMPIFIGIISYGLLTITYPFFLVGTLFYSDVSQVYTIVINMINIFLSIPAWFQGETSWYPSNFPPIWLWLLIASISINMWIRFSRILNFLKKWVDFIRGLFPVLMLFGGGKWL